MTGNEWLVVGTVLGGAATLGLLLVALREPIGAWWRGRVRRGVPKLEVNPTGGPSRDIRLVVTNRDRKGDFDATAALTASRHNPNQLRKGPYALMWLGRGSSTITLDRGQSHPLLIARWFEHPYHPLPPNVPAPPRLGEVGIIECNGSAEAEWDGFRWNFIADEPVPEFDLDVTVAGTGWEKPFRRSYTLRPAAWIGPLELIERKSV
jgi:hypothetical protein